MAGLSTVVDKAEKYGISGTGFLFVVLAALVGGLFFVAPSAGNVVLDYLILLAPFWLPVVLGAVFWKYWVTYIRSNYIHNQEHVVLEVRLPREIQKSPRAMEAVFDGLHLKPGESTFIDKYIKGKIRPWFSFELASIEGNVRFFVWTRAFMQKQVQNQIYAQYPDLEILEVDDYTNAVADDLSTYNIWGCDFKLSESSEPYLPIKTYVDYGLDKDPKEEYKIDPVANVLETLASLGPGEQMWVQIMFQVSRVSWKEKVREAVETIKKEATPEYVSESGTAMSGFPNPTQEQKDKMEALTRKLSKNGFDCGIRGLYIAETAQFDPSRIPALTSMFKQFSSNELNGIVPTRGMTKFDYPWQDFRERRQNRTRRELLDAFKRRAYFYPPYETESFVLNSEELATLYHYPGRAIQAPTLGRIPSTRAAPPTDLPV